jgi:hypothetical protein
LFSTGKEAIDNATSEKQTVLHSDADVFGAFNLINCPEDK